MSETFALKDYMPKDTLILQAWTDCLFWAVGNQNIMARFRVETGNTWEPGTTPVEKLIDRETGADRAFFAAFVPWFSENVWGDL